ncbi:MAG: hypothetical protein LBD50_02410 [Rickettsiales bacterium]|jgi:hypothetical protein|nr:hypothetical protein [Rickettsiales bacterium]
MYSFSARAYEVCSDGLQSNFLFKSCEEHIQAYGCCNRGSGAVQLSYTGVVDIPCTGYVNTTGLCCFVNYDGYGLSDYICTNLFSYVSATGSGYASGWEVGDYILRSDPYYVFLGCDDGYYQIMRDDNGCINGDSPCTGGSGITGTGSIPDICTGEEAMLACNTNGGFSGLCSRCPGLKFESGAFITYETTGVNNSDFYWLSYQTGCYAFSNSGRSFTDSVGTFEIEGYGYYTGNGAFVYGGCYYDGSSGSGTY